MRLSGLASGMDVDAMVKELMKARRSSYDKMIKNRVKVEWKQEDFRTMSTKIVDFRNNKLSTYNVSNVMKAKTSQVSGDTNALTVNATNSTASGTLSVQVTSVAKAANDVYTFADPSKTLEELGFTLEMKDEGSGPQPTGNVLATINGKTIAINKDAKLADLANAVNNSSSMLKATAVFDAASGKLSLAATQTGANGLSIGNFPPAVEPTNPPTVPTPAVTKQTITAGSDASVTVNGINYTSSTNRFTVNGVDFTVKAETAAGSPTMITAVQDTNKIIDTIKSFVADYNSLIGALNTELSEVNNRNYMPLTSEEKKEMTDDDIKRWEEKARNGTLRNDNTLTKLATELRLSATSLIGGIDDGSGNRLSIGITTGSYTEKGKLILDENKLRSALESNPDQVTDLFMNPDKGVFRQMSKSSMDALTDLSKKAGTSLVSTDLTMSFQKDSSIGKEIEQMKKRESAMLTRLNMLEKQYYKQFTAMETAINKFNSQSSSLSSL
ncbi:flagellar filament capping protein FliD [Paenibacillus spongiae]|uniref:Flagellar hook-associated protein 2 n=1 Tax=Paenibacillus spongiae TaxID=2909671 RepID=A0ABY5SAT7_9BACL|nr:flagellar filament capping protein FliD [Paenibacillus spongiae]UVI29890.1 flagellar filament capping protein FliD [Paenibacillus spongiae]